MVTYRDVEFTHHDLQFVLEAIQNGHNLDVYFEEFYAPGAIACIAQALTEEVPHVSKFVLPEFDALQLDLIINDLRSGYDVSAYAKPYFDYDQMLEIREGLMSWVDARRYANPEFTLEDMQRSRIAMLHGGDVTELIVKGYPTDCIDAYIEGLESGIDLLPYLLEGFDSDQLESIAEAIKIGVDADEVADMKFDGHEMRVKALSIKYGIDFDEHVGYTDEELSTIMRGLDQGVDMRPYLKYELGYLRNSELICTLKDGLDPTIMLEKDYSFGQMYVLHKALKYGVDTTDLANPELSVDDMNKMLLKLNSKKNF